MRQGWTARVLINRDFGLLRGAHAVSYLGNLVFNTTLIPRASREDGVARAESA